MLKTLSILLPVALLIFAGGYLSGVQAAGTGRVFELRTYTTFDGKLDALNARFRNHTIRIFEKHGMENIGYWMPTDEPNKGKQLVYIIAHKSRDAAKASWDAFRNDPEWKKVAAESEKDGKINQKVESVFLEPTDYSKIK
jgi:hypothetical protein